MACASFLSRSLAKSGIAPSAGPDRNPAGNPSRISRPRLEKRVGGGTATAPEWLSPLHRKQRRYNSGMFRLSNAAAAVSVGLLCAQLAPAQWVNLLNGKNLDGWQVVGEGF